MNDLLKKARENFRHIYESGESWQSWDEYVKDVYAALDHYEELLKKEEGVNLKARLSDDYVNYNLRCGNCGFYQRFTGWTYCPKCGKLIMYKKE